jgi:hypothetical protein
MALLLALSTPALAHNADRISPPRAVLVSGMAHLRGGALAVSVIGTEQTDGFFDDLFVDIAHQGKTLQRIRLEEYLNTSPRRGDYFLDIVDGDGDGNDDLWINFDNATQNQAMQLFRYDVRQRKFVPDRSFMSPLSDAQSGCVREHLNFGGAAGLRGRITVWCRMRGRWIKRFERTQDNSKHAPNSSTAIQTDHTVSPPRTERFDLVADNNGLAWDQRLPAWVAQLETRAALARQRRAAK